MKDKMGRWLTKALFFETALPEMRKKYDCLYTLKEFDHVSEDGTRYISLRQIYLSYMDPTEYKFAHGELGSWDHWNTLKTSVFFKEHYIKWREELEVKMLAEGFKVMMEEAQGSGKGKGVAARWLAEKGWDKESRKGRPSKRKIAEEAAKMDRVKEETEELLEHGRTLN